MHPLSSHNRAKRFKPNKPPHSHRISEDISEVLSIGRQCRSRDINYDDNIVKIEGDLTDILDRSLHNDEYSSDDCAMDDEYIPYYHRDCDTKPRLQKKQTKKMSLKYVPALVGSKNCDVVGDNEDDGDQIVVTGKKQYSHVKYEWVNELHAMDDSSTYGKSRFLSNPK